MDADGKSPKSITLHDWAAIKGVSYRTALRRYQAKKIPHSSRDEKSGKVEIELREDTE